MSAVRVGRFHLIAKRFYNTTYSSYAVSTLPHPKPDHYGVPPLEQSVEKYLAYTKPLVTPEQWENTRKIALQFMTSPEVLELQKSLESRAKLEENWLFDWWLDGYLSNRAPVVVHSNPGMRLKTTPFKSDTEWLMHATGIVRGVLNFKRRIESRTFPTDMSADGEAMCMAQFYALLCNCRIPGAPMDRILSRRGGPHSTLMSNHLCVFYRNRIFRMEFSDPVTREIVSEPLLFRQLEHIVAIARDLPPGPPVGLLTSLPRDEWAHVHRLLKQSVQNSNVLTNVERSLFVLCLDEFAELPVVNDSDPEALDIRDSVSSANVLHGNLINSGNRWFDKSVQFMVSRDGSVGANFEHTATDAGALVPMIADCYTAFDTHLQLGDGRLPIYSCPRELSWHVGPELETELRRAEDALKQLINSVEIRYTRFREFGSNAIKQLKASPDAFVQVALQLAYARLHPDLLPPPTYESGSLRRFFLGRTDTIRSCSQESVRFTKAMTSSSPTSKPNLAKLLQDALKRHQEFTQETLAGQGFDRHLLGLRLLAHSLSQNAPDSANASTQILFTDPTYAAANTYRLSTSQVRSPNDCAVVFGPVIPQGYGVCYNIHHDSIQITATSFRESVESGTPEDLLNQLSRAMLDMKELLQSTEV